MFFDHNLFVRDQDQSLFLYFKVPTNLHFRSLLIPEMLYSLGLNKVLFQWECILALQSNPPCLFNYHWYLR